MATPISEATSNPTDLSFGIRVPSNNPQNPSRQPFIMNARIRPAVYANGGTTMANGTVLSSIACMNQMIVINPTGTVAIADTYVLPSASTLLAEFGRNLDTGLSKAASGDILRLQIVNIGTNNAHIYASNATAGWGGDGSAIICTRGGATGVNATGAAPSPNANITQVFIRFNTVVSSMAGVSGTYSVIGALY